MVRHINAFKGQQQAVICQMDCLRLTVLQKAWLHNDTAYIQPLTFMVISCFSIS
jgi:hypothetical protein